MDGNASFGEWLQRWRRALGLTREELAGRVACAVVTLRKIETDERRPSEQMAARLADELGIEPDLRTLFVECARGRRSTARLPPPPIRVGADAPPGGASRGPIQLPVPTTSLVGRL